MSQKMLMEEVLCSLIDALCSASGLHRSSKTRLKNDFYSLYITGHDHEAHDLYRYYKPMP
jgi:hypothetical protein